MIIAPSILSADFLNLGKEVDFVNEKADLFHFDVMDGSFVPNLSFGFPLIEAIAPVAKKPIDVHLMIVNPDKYIDRFVAAGASMLSFHLEAAQDAGLDAAQLLAHTRSLGATAGLAIDPDVDIKELYPYIDSADFFVVMSVFAGFGGQKFIRESLGRVAQLKAEIRARGAKCLIEVDGGVDPDNAAALKEAGADIIVAGSSVFRAADRDKALAGLRL